MSTPTDIWVHPNMLMLSKCYTEPHRVYHTLKHIDFMFDAARRMALELNEAHRQAVWWHDAVYVPGSETNEHDSIVLFEENTEGMSDFNKRVSDIIMSTRYHTPATDEAAVVCDLDMYILASPMIEYGQYMREVCTEYTRFVTMDQYIKGRMRWLESQLNRGEVFNTELFKQFDNVALANIEMEFLAWEKLC